MTLGALVAAFATEHGYAARVDPSLAESPIAHVDQVAESDLHLLRRVVGHYNATLKAAAGHLVVVRRGSARTAGTGVPLPITTVAAPPTGVSTSIRGRVKVRGRARYGSVRASYYSAETAAVEYVQAGNEEPTYVIRESRPDAAQAAADAEAKLLELHRRTGTLELTLPGNPAPARRVAVADEGGGALPSTAPGSSVGPATSSRAVPATRPRSRPTRHHRQPLDVGTLLTGPARAGIYARLH